MSEFRIAVKTIPLWMSRETNEAEVVSRLLRMPGSEAAGLTRLLRKAADHELKVFTFAWRDWIEELLFLR